MRAIIKSKMRAKRELTQILFLVFVFLLLFGIKMMNDGHAALATGAPALESQLDSAQ